MRGNRLSIILKLFISCQALSVFCSPSQPLQQIKTNTWTIVAADPVTGEVGVAGASCVPDLHIDAVAALVPGIGAAAIQADFNISNRNYVFQLLEQGLSAGEIIQQISDPAYDQLVDSRQYGVVTVSNGQASAAAFTGSGNFAWAGDMQDDVSGVSVQGNFLVSESVVRDALEAFRRNDMDGFNTLADRLIRSLEAGSRAGGDARCNNDQVQQTASSAFLMVAAGSESPYVTRDFGVTDAGKPEAPELTLSTSGARYGQNPVVELRRQYDAWRADSTAPSGTWSGHVILYVGIGAFLLCSLAYLFYRKRYPIGK